MGGGVKERRAEEGGRRSAQGEGDDARWEAYLVVPGNRFLIVPTLMLDDSKRRVRSRGARVEFDNAAERGVGVFVFSAQRRGNYESRGGGRRRTDVPELSVGVAEVEVRR